MAPKTIGTIGELEEPSSDRPRVACPRVEPVALRVIVVDDRACVEDVDDEDDDEEEGDDDEGTVGELGVGVVPGLVAGGS